MANSLGIDPKKFKHVKSDEKTTTLQHKDGHTLTIAHNVLSPKMKEQLLALAKVPKMADGGEASDQYAHNPAPDKDVRDLPSHPENNSIIDRNKASTSSDYHAPASNAPEFAPEENQAQMDAEGGMISQQGQDVRSANKSSSKGDMKDAQMHQKFAKDEAKGRAQFEREAIKPKMKGLAEGGGPDKAPEIVIPGMPNKVDDTPPVQVAAQAPQTAPQFNDIDTSGQGAPNVSEAPPAGIASDQPQPEADATPTPQAAQADFDHIPATAEPMPEPGQPLSARQQAIQQVLTAKGTKEQQEENAKFAQDIQNGHISPKTYGDLFHDKSTLGKISMIFGLALSGAGSGMAHQQNAYLAMLDKTIANDLEAQKQSKNNASNFVKMNVDNELQKANSQLTQSQVGLTGANKALVTNNAKTIALNNSAIQMYTVALKQLMDTRAKAPEGSPARAAADTALSQFYQRFGDKITDATSAIAGAQAQNAMLFGEPGTGATGTPADRSEQAFQMHQNELMKQALYNPAAKQQYDINEAKHIPGIPGMASAPIPQPIRDKIQNMNILDNKVKDVIDYAQKNKGSINPNVLRTAKQKAEELTSFYNGSLDSLGMSQGRLGWLEEQIKKNPTSIIQQVLGNNATLREIRDSNVNRRDQILHGPGGLGFPKIQEQPQQQAAPQYKTDAQGVKWMRGPNGEAIKVK